MEYNELIEQARQATVDAPGTDTIMGGMRRTLRRCRQQRQTFISALLVLAVGASLTIARPSYGHPAAMTLAEQVSARLDSTPDTLPASLAGYRHSNYYRQIYTLI